MRHSIKRILVTGSRRVADRGVVERALDELLEDTNVSTTLVHGDAAGMDATAARVAWELFGFKPEAHPADWSRGLGAGYERNQAMVDLGADVCLAFPCERSKGTWDCVRRAVLAGIPTRVWIVEPEVVAQW